MTRQTANGYMPGITEKGKKKKKLKKLTEEQADKLIYKLLQAEDEIVHYWSLPNSFNADVEKFNSAEQTFRICLAEIKRRLTEE